MNESVLKDEEVITNIVLKGDISGLKPAEKVRYYRMFCESLGLNPVTQPFQIISFQGKERLYATKDATEQLRKINGVSVIDIESRQIGDIYVVTVKGRDKTGRTDAATGAVDVRGMKGNDLANAIMKTETKAKRRLTLSICGLGVLDESEIETIPGERIFKRLEPDGETTVVQEIPNAVNEDTKNLEDALIALLASAVGILDAKDTTKVRDAIPKHQGDANWFHKALKATEDAMRKQEELLKANTKPNLEAEASDAGQVIQNQEVSPTVEAVKERRDEMANAGWDKAAGKPAAQLEIY